MDLKSCNILVASKDVPCSSPQLITEGENIIITQTDLTNISATVKKFYTCHCLDFRTNSGYGWNFCACVCVCNSLYFYP